MRPDIFGARATLATAHGSHTIYRLDALAKAGLASGFERLPFSIRVLLEAVLRNVDGELVTEDDVKNLAAWNAPAPKDVELPFMPARVILQDFTGVPAVVDLASMRGAVKRLGGDPKRINPLVPVDLVVDHSVQVDAFASPEALATNAELEFQRNSERYEFLRWGQKAFADFRVVPPATGIVHQVNLEFLAKGVLTRNENGKSLAFPDTLVGTDSHTTMINGLGVLGWGVGGIEAEAVMLGQPLYMVTPQVVGMKLSGKLREGVTATDLVLTVTQQLRKKGVVEKFVEFFGPGLAEMSLADRATMANMAPEYGATCGFFPVDDETLRYLRRTGRSAAEVDLVERYTKEQGLFRGASSPDPIFTDTLELDLDAVEPSLAGPKRPQDRIALAQMKDAFRKALAAPVKERGFGLAAEELSKSAPVAFRGDAELKHGAVVIAAITSCTNTSNPSVMLGAGLAGTEGGRSRAQGARLREDEPRAGVEGRDRVPGEGRPHEGPRGSWLPHRGLRVYDVHRQQRSAARAREQGREPGEAGSLGGALGQPQLRGPHQPRREGQLPRLAAAGRRLCPGRHDRHRPDEGADRDGPGWQARDAVGDLAHAEGSGGAGGPGLRRDVPQDLRQRLRRQPGVERDSRLPEASCSTSRTPRPTSRTRRSSRA